MDDINIGGFGGVNLRSFSRSRLSAQKQCRSKRKWSAPGCAMMIRETSSIWTGLVGYVSQRYVKWYLGMP